MTHKILRVDASARHDGSVSRDLTDKVIARLGATEVVTRDLTQPLPLIDGTWVGANFTPADQLDARQKGALALSDMLIQEIKDADTLVIGLPVYNFGVPAGLKAWIDQIVRAGVAFRYTENGPEGLLKGKRAIVVFASGGTQLGSEVDFASGYVKFVLGFIGITDVEFVAADRLQIDGENALKSANETIDALAPAA